MLKNKYYFLLMFLLFAMLFTQVHYPQQISSKLYSGMQWRLVGPHRGGWGTVCDGIPDSLNTFYFGGAGGGVWRTRDAGNSWQALMQNESASSVGALTISPSDPNIIYAGTGQVAWRYDILEGNGVYKSVDGGETWKNIGLKETKHIGKILVDPNNSDRILVAALGPVFGSSKNRGIFLSSDGGEIWKQVLYVNDSTGAVDLAYDPLHPKIIYAALWQMRMHPWLDYYIPQVGMGSGIYKSIDNGEHWARFSITGLDDVPLGRIGLAVAQGSGGEIVYAIIDATKNKKGLYRSNDGGENWSLVNKDSVLADNYFCRINLHPGNSEVVYVMGQSIRRSVDGGKTFTIFRGAPGGDDYHYLWINPKNPNYMVTASDQGTIVTVNGGGTWSSWYNQPTGQLYHLAADDRFPYRIYAGQQDNGTVSILSRGPYGVIEDRDWHPVGANERDYDIPNPGDPDMVIGSGLGGALARFDEITRQSAEISPYPLSSYAAKQNTVKLRYSWITPIAFSPIGKHALYFGAQFLFRSLNNGSNWEVVSPDLSRKSEDSTNCTDPDLTQAADCGYGVIWSIAPSPIDEKIIWIGTDDGLIQLTTDEGLKWSNVTPPDVPLWGRIDAIDPSPFSVHSAYVAVNLHRLNNFTPLILKTTDNGKTWKKIINGLPEDEYINVVRTDHDKEGLLFTGTNRGVYVSFDDGINWHPLKLNFPTTSVRDLLVHKNDLIAATQGRAIWILDDLQPLREIDETMVNNSVHLFTPSDAWRIRGNENRDTPWPPSTALGKNPPDGAIIYYWLKKDAQKITLKISDTDGNIIREYSNLDKPENLNAFRYFDKRWLGTPALLSGKSGMHRFVWDLRYTRPKALKYSYTIAGIWKEGTPVNPLGPIVLPGKYNITLNVDGEKFTRQLNVKMDPRVDVRPEQLKQQLVLAQTVISALEKTVDVYNQIDVKLKDSVNVANKEISDSLKRLISNVDKISNVFAGIVTSVQRADTDPSQGQFELYDEYWKKFEEILKKWKSIQTKLELNY